MTTEIFWQRIFSNYCIFACTPKVFIYLFLHRSDFQYHCNLMQGVCHQTIHQWRQLLSLEDGTWSSWDWQYLRPPSGATFPRLPSSEQGIQRVCLLHQGLPPRVPRFFFREKDITEKPGPQTLHHEAVASPVERSQRVRRKSDASGTQPPQRFRDHWTTHRVLVASGESPGRCGDVQAAALPSAATGGFASHGGSFVHSQHGRYRGPCIGWWRRELKRGHSTFRRKTNFLLGQWWGQPRSRDPQLDASCPKSSPSPLPRGVSAGLCHSQQSAPRSLSQGLQTVLRDHSLAWRELLQLSQGVVTLAGSRVVYVSANTVMSFFFPCQNIYVGCKIPKIFRQKFCSAKN